MKEAGEGLYFDPPAPAQQLIVEGVREIVKNYQVDGIHFDDYFTPPPTPAFDAAEYAAAGQRPSLDEWRRQNVDALVQGVYAAIIVEKPAVRFGVSPQGNMDNNYNGQYSDVALWMSTPDI